MQVTPMQHKLNQKKVELSRFYHAYKATVPNETSHNHMSTSLSKRAASSRFQPPQTQRVYDHQPRTHIRQENRASTHLIRWISSDSECAPLPRGRRTVQCGVGLCFNWLRLRGDSRLSQFRSLVFSDVTARVQLYNQLARARLFPTRTPYECAVARASLEIKLCIAGRADCPLGLLSFLVYLRFAQARRLRLCIRFAVKPLSYVVERRIIKIFNLFSEECILFVNILW